MTKEIADVSRPLFLTIVSVVAVLIGSVATFFPAVLLEQVKHATAAPPAIAMARTVGVLLLSVGVLNFAVRNHPDSPTMRAILLANLVLQLAILPLDPLAYAVGTFHTLGSFLPNTILHVVLAAGFAIYARSCTAPHPAPPRPA